MILLEADKSAFLLDELGPSYNSTVEHGTIILSAFILLILFSFAAILLWRYRDHTLVIRIRQLIREMYNGLVSVRNLKSYWPFILTTVAIWVCYYAMSYLMVFATPETDNLSFEVGFMLLVLGGIAMSAPVQGGIGTFHILVSQGLALYQLSPETGIFFATLLHGSQVVLIVLSGSVSFIYLLLFRFKQNNGRYSTQNT
jgi:hypothetical protein